MNTGNEKQKIKECFYSITGNVQGVSYRVFVRHVAEQLKVVGTVENKRDGSVEIVAQGTEDVLKQFTSRVHHGVHHAHIEHVRTTLREPSQKYSNFSIIQRPYV